MSENKRNALIGAFVLGGLAALAVLIVKFGEAPSLFGKRYIVVSRFDRITAVREGIEVRLAGVWIGSVRKVDLVQRDKPNEGVIVVMEVNKEYSIQKGSVALVDVPLMGQPIVNIMPPPQPSEPLPKDGTALIYGKVVNPLEQILDPKFMAALEKTTTQIGTLAEALTPAAKAVTDLLQERTIEQVESPDAATKRITGNLYTLVERLNGIAKHIDMVVGDPNVQSNFRDTLNNFKAASEEVKVAVEGLKKFSEGAQQITVDAHVVVGKLDSTVEATHQHVDILAKKLAGNLDQVTTLLDSFNAAGKDMAEGKGAIGMLLRDQRFAETLMLTVQRLKLAADDLQVTIKQWQAAGFPVKLR